MEHPRLLRPPHRLRFHPTKGTVPERHLSHSLPSRVGVYCPSGHYAAPYPSWAGQLGALRAMLVHHAPPPATQTLPCLVSRLHHDPHRAIARNPDDRSTTDAHQLRYASTWPVSLSTTATLVGVNLVRQSGAPAFTGNYMVNILPRDSPSSDTAIFCLR